MDKFRSSLFWPLVLPVPAVLIVLLIATAVLVPDWVDKAASESAITSGKQTVKQFKTIRAYYTKNVIVKLKKNGFPLKPHYNHKSMDKGLPLPATFIHDMSQLLEEEATSVTLYSPYPFPNREERQLDDFQQAAWTYLNQNPDATFSLQEEKDGRRIIRVALADKMVAPVCVDCHNRQGAPFNSPKTDWKLNDVRGILEVATDIEDQIGAGAALSNTIIGSTLAGGAVLIAFVVVGARRVTNPLNDMTQSMKNLADGHLSIDIPAKDRADEIGRMAGSLEVFKTNAAEIERLKKEEEEQERLTHERQLQNQRDMADSFEGSVMGIVETVASSTSQMKGSSELMVNAAANTSDQSSLAASQTEQAVGNIETVASAATQLSASVDEIARQVTTSTGVADRAVEEASRTNDTVQGLSEAVQKIGEVVNLITDIAEQTNLLALNATIEAARAGDAGKGFAVVAAEVKSLATQTAKATEDIRIQIETVQNATGEAVRAIDGIGSTIGQINEISASVAVAVDEQRSATEEIARNIEQAVSGAQGVLGNISEVSSTAQETGTAAQDVLAASTELMSQSQTLRDQVTTFLEGVRTG
ncbi:MAG: hypothetical protein CMM59_08680 [Rhodospirillaceae bacterium]|nr:hypothetical protein [Rhodospirillaceae bacterium]